MRTNNQVMERAAADRKSYCPNCKAAAANGHAVQVKENGSLGNAVNKNSGHAEEDEVVHRRKDELNSLCGCKNSDHPCPVTTCQPPEEKSCESGKKNSSVAETTGTQDEDKQKIVKSPSSRRVLEKSYTLPSKLNGIVGLKRNQKHIFSGKMEVLDEEDKTIPVLGQSPANVRSSGNVRTQTKKSSKSGAENNSPRYMTSVCPKHDGRSGGETLEAVLYCSMCVQSVCYKCAFEMHKDHSVSPIPAAAESIRINLAERKRKIENTISQMRAKRKSVETSHEEALQRIHAQFEQVMQRIRKKKEDINGELEKLKQKRTNLIYGVQNQQEMNWGQIDAVLKTQDDVKMLEEYSSLAIAQYKESDGSDNSLTTPREAGEGFLLHGTTPRPNLDLNAVQDEIEKICLKCCEVDSTFDGNDVVITNGITPRHQKKRFTFKLDAVTAHSALKVSANYSSVEYVGAERNGINLKHTSLSPSNPYLAKLPFHGGLNGRLKRAQFATILGDSSITQGKQYWEVSVNRSMEYRLGVAYKHMQGTRSLADDHNSWALCLTYPDRFSAIHKHHKEYIFVPTHAASHATKVIRIGVFLDYERGVLSFYNASTAAEKRHLYTFRTFFNRPVWPMLSLRQGKLQILTGLPVPRNLVWKTR